MAGKLAAVVVVVVMVGTLLLFHKSAREVEGMDRYAKNFHAAEQMHLMGLCGAELGPEPLIPADPVLQAAGATAESLMAHSELAKPTFKTDVVDQMTAVEGARGLGPSIKGHERAIEKIRSEYDGDARRLKDVLRCSVICETMPGLCECFRVLESLPEVTILQARARRGLRPLLC